MDLIDKIHYWKKEVEKVKTNKELFHSDIFNDIILNLERVTDVIHHIEIIAGASEENETNRQIINLAHEAQNYIPTLNNH